ncbi:25147_t:CDS:2 [Gigaspora margarita]|uniref:25147_t:CDS:1 n=1 Tax=Gigaspora margarita TaxID=4874 RepID=A0ABN7UZC2_GIGMA|nr:25147_t:CDS:2 [Gigaspora margarita]
MDYDYDNAKRRLFIPRYVAITINALAICFAVSKFIVFSIEVLPGDEIIEGIELIYLFILTLLFLLDSTYTYYIKGEAYIPFFGCHFLTNNPGCAMNIIGLTIIWFMPAYYIIICQLLWFWIKKSVQNIVEVSGVDTGNPFLSVFQSSRLADKGLQSSRFADGKI